MRIRCLVSGGLWRIPSSGFMTFIFLLLKPRIKFCFLHQQQIQTFPPCFINIPEKHPQTIMSSVLFLGEEKIKRSLKQIVEETKYFIKNCEVPGVVTRWKRMNPRLVSFNLAIFILNMPFTLSIIKGKRAVFSTLLLQFCHNPRICR